VRQSRATRKAVAIWILGTNFLRRFTASSEISSRKTFAVCRIAVATAPCSGIANADVSAATDAVKGGDDVTAIDFETPVLIRRAVFLTLRT